MSSSRPVPCTAWPVGCCDDAVDLRDTVDANQGPALDGGQISCPNCTFLKKALPSDYVVTRRLA
jgi:hypothetical protein